jgi:hypothetical protein
MTTALSTQQILDIYQGARALNTKIADMTGDCDSEISNRLVDSMDELAIEMATSRAESPCEILAKAKLLKVRLDEDGAQGGKGFDRDNYKLVVSLVEDLERIASA